MPEGSHSLKARCPEGGQSVVFELCSTLVLFRNWERKINPKSMVQSLLRFCIYRLEKPLRGSVEVWLPSKASDKPVPRLSVAGARVHGSEWWLVNLCIFLGSAAGFLTSAPCTHLILLHKYIV